MINARFRFTPSTPVNDARFPWAGLQQAAYRRTRLSPGRGPCNMSKVSPVSSDQSKEVRFEEEFRKLAAKWDADGNGTFSMEECKAMVKELTTQKGRITYDMKNKVDAQMAKFDQDGNGQFVSPPPRPATWHGRHTVDHAHEQGS